MVLVGSAYPWSTVFLPSMMALSLDTPNPIHTSMLHAFSAAGVLSSPGPGWFRRSSIKGPGLGPQEKAQVMVHGSRMMGDAVRTVGTAPKTNKRRNMPARDQDMAWIKG